MIIEEMVGIDVGSRMILRTRSYVESEFLFVLLIPKICANPSPLYLKLNCMFDRRLRKFNIRCVDL